MSTATVQSREFSLCIESHGTDHGLSVRDFCSAWIWNGIFAGARRGRSHFWQCRDLRRQRRRLVGMIPNCAASVLITQLYISGFLGSGALFAGTFMRSRNGASRTVPRKSEPEGEFDLDRSALCERCACGDFAWDDAHTVSVSSIIRRRLLRESLMSL